MKIKVLLLLSLFLMISAFHSLADIPIATDKDNIDIEKDKSLTISLKSATEYDYPPFSVTENGEADGFSVELLTEVAKVMDLNVEFRVDYWDTIKNDLKNGELDVLPLVGYSIERENDFDFTVPYIVMRGNIFVRDTNTSISSEEDLVGKEIIVMTGDNAMEYASRNQLTDKLIYVKTYTEGFKLLSEGKHDAFLGQSIVGQKIINDMNLTNIKVVSRYDENGIAQSKLNLSGYEQKFCFAVSEGNKELLSKLNEGLVLVSENGTYDTLYKKWFPFLIENKVSTGTIVLSTGLALIPIVIILLVIMIFIMRKEINNRTKLLEETNNKLEAEKKVAIEALKVKGQFLANMSHEIRTPLNGIKGTMDLIQTEPLTDNQVEYLRLAASSFDVLLALINDILDYSKLEVNMVNLRRECVNIKNVFEDIITTFQPLASQKYITLDLEIQSESDDVIVGDTFRLKQIFNNLIGNAIKFTENGSVTVSVSIRDIQVNKSQLIVSIKDTGEGISKENLSKLFTEFSQFSNAKRSSMGTGLGLAIAKMLTEKMGCDLTVESELDKGSIFTVKGLFDKQSSIAESHHDMAEKKKRILLVDDDHTNTIIIKRLMNQIDIEVAVETNGLDGVERILKDEFNLLLIDLQSKDMDGLEVAQLLRERYKSNIPIIAIFSDNTHVDRSIFTKVGINDFIVKPYKKDDLHNIVLKWIKKVSENQV